MPPGYVLKVDKAALERVHLAAAEGLKKAADYILAQSMQEVPVDEGRELSESGETSVDRNTLQAAVSFGRNGIARAYAVSQHESMELEHDEGRKAKFLEDPMNASRTEAGEIIAREIRKVT